MLCKVCYHGDVLTTVSANTAAVERFLLASRAFHLLMKQVWVRLLSTASKMLTFQLKASVPPSEFSSSAMSCGLGAPRCPTCSNFRMGACGGQKAFRQNQIERKYLVIQPLKSELACVVHLLQAADAVFQLRRGVQCFLGLGHQTKSKLTFVKLNT